MDTVEVKHKYLLTKWAPIIQECRNSGLTVKAWCAENSINEKQFFYWQRRVREDLCSNLDIPTKEQLITFQPLKSQNSHREVSKSGSFEPDMVLKIGNCQIDITNQASPQLLEIVLKVVSNV